MMQPHRRPRPLLAGPWPQGTFHGVGHISMRCWPSIRPWVDPPYPPSQTSQLVTQRGAPHPVGTPCPTTCRMALLHVCESYSSGSPCKGLLAPCKGPLVTADRWGDYSLLSAHHHPRHRPAVTLPTKGPLVTGWRTAIRPQTLRPLKIQNPGGSGDEGTGAQLPFPVRNRIRTHRTISFFSSANSPGAARRSPLPTRYPAPVPVSAFGAGAPTAGAQPPRRPAPAPPSAAPPQARPRSLPVPAE